MRPIKSVEKANRKPANHCLATVCGFLGPSDWIRTSGLLNPIQARYQTSPHPEIFSSLALTPDSLDSIPRLFPKCKSFFKIFFPFRQIFSYQSIYGKHHCSAAGAFHCFVFLSNLEEQKLFILPSQSHLR